MQGLLLKCNTGTQNYIDHVKMIEKRDAEEKQKENLNKMDIDGETGAEKDSGEDTADVENKALEKIMGIVSNLEETLPAPPEAAAEAFLSKLATQEAERGKEERTSSRDRHRSSRREVRSDSRLPNKLLSHCLSTPLSPFFLSFFLSTLGRSKPGCNALPIKALVFVLCALVLLLTPPPPPPHLHRPSPHSCRVQAVP